MSRVRDGTQYEADRGVVGVTPLAVYFITSEYAKASADYDKSTELDKDFVFSHVQKAVCEYKVGKIRESMVAFRKILKDFPQRSEPFNY
jgi:import receptor subunit TOM70